MSSPSPPLDVPSVAAGEQELVSSPAVTLFAHRARAVRSGFTLDEASIRSVAEICRRLDGMPLAIELAATRVKVLPPDEILARLATNLDILAGGPRDHPARLRSMRATIAWSYDLLEPRQQALLRWLALFAAGCPVDVAEAMAVRASGDGSPETESPLEIIAALVDASLVRQAQGLDGRVRLVMLETIRQFALEKLGASADHAWMVGWCTDLTARAAAAYSGRGPDGWHTLLRQEHDTFRAALTTLRSRGDHEAFLCLATVLAPLWSALGNEREGYHWLVAALERADWTSAEVRVRALAVTARLANALGELEEAESLASRGQALAVEVNDERGLADMLCALGNVARGLGDEDSARRRYTDALARYRALDDRYNTGYTLIQLAKLGDLGTVGHPGDEAALARATAYCEEALEIYRALDNGWGIARALHQLGYLAYKSRAYLHAARLSRDALELFWRHGNVTEAASPIEDLADVAGATGHGATAARLYGVAESVRERLGVPMWPSYRPEYEREVEVARSSLAEDQFAREWQAGRALGMAKAVELATDLADLLAAEATGLADAPRLPVPTVAADLTNRELDVLRLVAAGSSNQAIADALFISVTTVKGHVRSIMDKLDIRSRTSLAAWAHTHDLA